MAKVKKAYGYLRVSGKGQVQGDGFTRQEKAIRDYAAANGIEVVRVFKEEGVSGTLRDRPTLARVMLHLEENGEDVNAIVIEKMDRLARDLMVQESIINDLQKNGFDLISTCEGPDLLSNDPTRKLVRQVMGSIAEYDKCMTVLKLKASRDRIRAAGTKCEGRKSYSEVAPATIAEIKRLRRKPKGGRRRTFEQVAAILNAQGISTATGTPWTGNNISTLLHRI